MLTQPSHCLTLITRHDRRETVVPARPYDRITAITDRLP
jgi:hypothetical protein